MQQKLIVISDQIGRIVAGKLVSETDTTVTILNPVIIEQEVQQGGQLSVHTFPYMCIEFTVGGEASHEWTFNKSQIGISKIELEPRLEQLVRQINQPKQAAAPVQDAKIVNLFDGE